jgi:hypothetical protein
VATYGRGVWDAPLFVAGALPVKWLSFTAEKNASGNLLNWKVNGETSRTMYEIQRSRNGLDFIRLENILARGQQISGYQYTDHRPFAGMNYYRIKETEGGREYYSRIISIRNDNKNQQVEIAPNPVTDGLLRFGFVNADAQPFDVNIINTDGRLMLAHKQTDSYGVFNISNLPAGTYYLVVKREKELYKTPFVKTK